MSQNQNIAVFHAQTRGHPGEGLSEILFNMFPASLNCIDSNSRQVNTLFFSCFGTSRVIFSLFLFDSQNCPKIGDIVEFVSFYFQESINKCSPCWKSAWSRARVGTGHRVPSPVCDFHIWLMEILLDDRQHVRPRLKMK